MEGFRQKLDLLSKNRGLRAAYCRWILSRLTSTSGPRLKLSQHDSVGGWISFSEYWAHRSRVAASTPEFSCAARSAKAALRRSVAFDVGANIGTFTCVLANTGFSEIHAFEPIPETFCRFKNNVKSNGLLDRCRLNCLALGRGRDLVTFRIYEDSPASNRMAMPGEKPVGKATSTQVVAAIDLDGYCQSQNVEFIDFLKIDVEGMEPYVLQGARALLKGRKIAAILIEICPANLRAVGLSPADLYREFETVRYSPYALNDDGRPGAKLPLAEIEAMSLANVVLFPDA